MGQRIRSRTCVPLKIAAKVDKVDEDYFRNDILPLLDGPGVEFIGEINEREKTKFLGGAAALLFQVDWPVCTIEVHPCEQYCSEMFEPRNKTGGLKGAPID